MSSAPVLSAEAQHPQHQRREQPCRLEPRADARALGDLSARVAGGLLDRPVPGDALADADALQHRDPGCVEEREAAREPGEEDALHDRTHQPGPELERVDRVRRRRARPAERAQEKEGGDRYGENGVPVRDEQVRDENERPRAGRELLPHPLDEGDELRHEMGHQEEHDEHHDGARDGRVREQPAHQRHLLVLPLQVLVEAAEDLSHPTRQLAGLDEVDEDRLEHPRVLAHRAGQRRAALDRHHHVGEHLAQTRVAGGVAQRGESFQHRHPGGHELLHVEAEPDEIAAADPAAPDRAPRPRLAEGDEVEPEPPEPRLQVGRVGGLHLAGALAAALVDRLVSHQRHQPPTRLVRSTTRDTSSRLVVPSSTRRIPSSARGRKPLKGGRLRDVDSRRPTRDELVEPRVEPEQFQQCEAAPIALVLAAIASPRPIHRRGFRIRVETEDPALQPRRLVRLPASRAEPPHQPLAHDADDVAGHDAGGDSGFDEARDGAGGGVGVQGGVDLVAGHGGPGTPFPPSPRRGSRRSG